MSAVLLAAIAAWLAFAIGAVVFRNAVLLRLHHALRVHMDEAPGAHAQLIELCHARGIGRPRLFVIAAD